MIKSIKYVAGAEIFADEGEIFQMYIDLGEQTVHVSTTPDTESVLVGHCYIVVCFKNRETTVLVEGTGSQADYPFFRVPLRTCWFRSFDSSQLKAEVQP